MAADPAANQRGALQRLHDTRQPGRRDVQHLGRAHRIGQDKVVTVYRLIAAGTVEEKILDLSEKKRSLVANVLSSEGSPLKGLTKADVESLFSD